MRYLPPASLISPKPHLPLMPTLRPHWPSSTISNSLPPQGLSTGSAHSLECSRVGTDITVLTPSHHPGLPKRSAPLCAPFLSSAPPLYLTQPYFQPDFHHRSKFLVCLLFSLTPPLPMNTGSLSPRLSFTLYLQHWEQGQEHSRCSTNVSQINDIGQRGHNAPIRG